MKNMDSKKLILIGVLLASLIALILLWPFGMQVVKDGSSFQSISKVHGENLTLTGAMRRLGTAGEKMGQWQLIETSSEYAVLSRIAGTEYQNAYTWFIVRLVLCCILLIAALASVVLLKKTKQLLLILGALVMVFPFYWMIASSFKTQSEMNLFPPTMMPQSWTNFDNYTTAWHTAPFTTYFFNSIFVCVCSVLVVMLTTILAAFAFSRLQFPGRDLLFTLLLSMMMVPFELLVITNYQTITRLGMRDTLASLILPFTSSIFYTYILRNFFMSVPDSLYYSSQVDGSSNWQYLWKVMVPIASPSLVTILLLNAMASWNSFMWPKLVISRDEVRTLPWALITFTTEVGIHYELIMAGATLVVMPMLILFLFARKQIVRGVARGGIKG